MKILIPIDFSKSSNNAAIYAAQFAKKVNAEIILFHVVHFEHPPMLQVSGFIEHQIEDIRISNASQDCVLLVKELESKVKDIKISFKVIPGFPIDDIIETYATTNKIDLIIMGTKGASGIEKILFGSNAVAVINRSTIPVITVPESSRFHPIHLIVYASDMQKIMSEIKKIIPFAKLFDAAIEILHIQTDDPKKKIDVVAIKNNIIEKYKYQKISLHITPNSNIIEGINKFVVNAKADILVMYTHEMGFFENLFKLHLSREEAFHCLVPLLTFKK